MISYGPFNLSDQSDLFDKGQQQRIIELLRFDSAPSTIRLTYANCNSIQCPADVILKLFDASFVSMSCALFWLIFF
jgi:hypothetical protein